MSTGAVWDRVYDLAIAVGEADADDEVEVAERADALRTYLRPYV